MSAGSNNTIKILSNYWKTYIADNEQTNTFFYNDIVAKYTNSDRHYHNLNHLLNLIKEFNRFQISLDQTILGSIFFHDIIYDSKSKTNEIDSAEIAKLFFKSINFEDKVIEDIYINIVATAKHFHINENESNTLQYFLDADLSILGKESIIYKTYMNQVRQEYIWVPQEQYNEGRSAILKSMLAMPKLYRTSIFQDAYEDQARKNISFELMQLEF